jgi:hypothetical protein
MMQDQNAISLVGGENPLRKRVREILQQAQNALKNGVRSWTLEMKAAVLIAIKPALKLGRLVQDIMHRGMISRSQLAEWSNDASILRTKEAILRLPEDMQYSAA